MEAFQATGQLHAGQEPVEHAALGGDGVADRRLAVALLLALRVWRSRLDVVLVEERLLASGVPLRALVEADRVSWVILWRPPATMKATVARLIARASSAVLIEL